MQYNLIDRKAKIAAQYQQEMFDEIEVYIKGNQDITNIILAGDLNQNIASSAVQNFFNKIGIRDIYQTYHQLKFNQMNNTEERGLKLIDTIAASYGISEYVEGSKLNECNDIIFTDHRSYIVDINIED